MLCLTTRSRVDTMTAMRAMTESAAGGGYPVPMRLPRLDRETVNQLPRLSFGQRAADILNLLLGTGLTGWDVECAVGRNPVSLHTVGRRVRLAEAWHNPQWVFSWFTEQLTVRLTGKTAAPEGWAGIAVRLAMLFGVFGELGADGLDWDRPMDVSVAAGDFSAPLSLWYGREMGLPIGTVICCCNENGGLWELLRYGQLEPGGEIVRTSLPDCDRAVPDRLECLIFETLGPEETERYTRAIRTGGVYTLSPEKRTRLGRGLWTAVVGAGRVQDLLRGAYRADGYEMDPYGALAYGGLQDYRAGSGVAGDALLWSEQGPSRMPALIRRSLGLTDSTPGFRPTER